MHSLTEENYLKAIYKIAESGDGFITTNDIARKLKTTAASVTDMLKKLARKKLIRYKKYHGLTLTESGKKIALTVIRKHRLWEMFLVKTLKFKWNEVHDVAEQLEHIHSDKLIQHIDRFLNYPKTDPHGDPIPDVNGKFFQTKSKSFSLSEGKEEKIYIMNGVIDHSDSFLQLLDKSGMRLGCKIKVCTIQSYDKSFSILVNGRKRLYISNQIAGNILVTSGSERK
jgi:DtxR family Mn-dependent transcriptional regulator